MAEGNFTIGISKIYRSNLYFFGIFKLFRISPYSLPFSISLLSWY